MQRIGVFVCHCGTNIAGTVDVAAVTDALEKENGVVYATHYTYMCSASGQNLIADAIKEKKLTGVVVCSCSPGCMKIRSANVQNVRVSIRICLKLQISANRIHGYAKT